MEDKIILTAEDGEELELYVLEETRIGGKNYLLAADRSDGDSECYLLKDESDQNAAEAVYEIVEDEKEQEYLLRIFNELLDDVEIEQ